MSPHILQCHEILEGITIICSGSDILVLQVQLLMALVAICNVLSACQTSEFIPYCPSQFSPPPKLLKIANLASIPKKFVQMCGDTMDGVMFRNNFTVLKLWVTKIIVLT